MKKNIIGNILINHMIIFSVILLVNLLIFFSFINGFLYPRQGITNKSEDLELFSRKVFGDDYIESLKKNKNVFSIINAPYNRLVILLIDSLRFDFALYDPNYKKEEEREDEEVDDEVDKKRKSKLYENKYFLNNMMNLHNVLKKEKKNSLLFLFEADPPTITTSRLKSIFIGTVPNYMDVNENFSPNLNIQDNFVEQLNLNGKNITVIGDDTITYLFRNLTKELVYESFNIYDFYSLDIASKKHFYEEYFLNYWDFMYIHVLGVDHAGHIKGPNSKTMKNILKDFDLFIYDIINKIKLEKDKRTLFLVIGDHGQMNSGDHGGSSADETESALFAYSQLDFISLNKKIYENNFILYDKDSLKNSIFANNDHIISIDGYKKYHSSLNNINKNNTYYYNIKHTKQLNLISTLSLLIGSTLPFCNIGNIILDMIPTSYIYKNSNLKKKENEESEKNKENKENEKNEENKENKENKEGSNSKENYKNNTHYNKNEDIDNHSNLYYDLLNLHYISELNYANLWQINRYLNTYETKYRLLKNRDYFYIKSTWKEIKEKKSHFFKPNKNFVDDEKILKREQMEYIAYINKMRNLMNFTQKYFYSIFTMKNHSFLILCFFINIYFFIIFLIFYYQSKLNYYHNTIKKSIYFSIIALFILLLPFNSYNKNIYLLLFPCLFVLYFVTYILSKNKYKDLTRFFNYAKITLFFNNDFLQDIKEKEYKNIKEQENIEIIDNDKKNSISKDNNNILHNFINSIKCFYNMNGKNAVHNKNIKYKVKDLKENKTYAFYNICNVINLFYTFKRIFFQILIDNRYFVYVIIWSSFLLSFNYVDKERYMVHYILFGYVVFCLFKCKNKLSLNFIRGFPVLAILIINASFSFTSDFFDHTVEKILLNKLMLKITLPISFYLLSLKLINSGINKLLQKNIKCTVIQIWTLQFVFVFLYLLKINYYFHFIVPPFIYILTFSLYAYILLRKNSIIETTELPITIHKIHEVSISLFIILFSSIQLSLIIYSNTNLSVLLLFYITLAFFYFFFLSINSLENNEDINNIIIIWINENRDIRMFGVESKSNDFEAFHVNTSIKEKMLLKLQKEKNNMLNQCNLLSQADITQMQIFKLIKNFSFYFINETDFCILCSILLKYTFFITGHKLVFNKLPISSAYVGLNKYVWPLSQFYLFNHIFYPYIFSLFFVIYIFNLRRIKIMLSFKESDFYNFYFYPLINFLFKILFLFCFKFILSIWVSFYLNLHIMLHDYFLPNCFYLTVINILYVSFCLMILSITKCIFLK